MWNDLNRDLKPKTISCIGGTFTILSVLLTWIGFALRLNQIWLGVAAVMCTVLSFVPFLDSLIARFGRMKFWLFIVPLGVCIVLVLTGVLMNVVSWIDPTLFD